MATVEGKRGDLVTLAVDGDVAHHNILELRASRPATKDYCQHEAQLHMGRDCCMRSH
eukprot:COSAG01_NODE_12354_length_1754_cov_1.354683_2_plen_57_part_00